MRIQIDLLQEAAKIYDDQQSSRNSEIVRGLRGVAYDTTKLYRDGNGGLTAEFLSALRGLSGNAGVLTLLLAYTALIGETSAQTRASMREQADQHAFNPAFSKHGGPASVNRAERRTRRAVVQHALDHAVDWLDHHNTGPVHAIVYAVMLSVEDGPEGDADQGCVDALALGLCFLAAWRTDIIMLPGSQVPQGNPHHTRKEAT